MSEHMVWDGDVNSVITHYSGDLVMDWWDDGNFEQFFHTPTREELRCDLYGDSEFSVGVSFEYTTIQCNIVEGLF